MTIQDALNEAGLDFVKATDHLKTEFARLQIGRASSALVENVPVEVYGSAQPLKAIASISIPDSRTIQITPWDKKNLAGIEKGIVGVGLGLNPVNDGVCVRISIPPLTEERRKDLTKVVHKFAEEGRIIVRNKRQDCNNAFKKMKSAEEITEDDLHSAEKQLQDKVDAVNSKIDDMARDKEKEVMTV